MLADTQERLSDALYDAGFVLLSCSWGEQALETLDRLLAGERDEESRRLLLERKLDLAERVAEVHLTLDRETLPEQVPS